MRVVFEGFDALQHARQLVRAPDQPVDVAVERVEADRYRRADGGEAVDDGGGQFRAVGDEAEPEADLRQIVQHVQRVAADQRLAALDEQIAQSVTVEIGEDVEDFVAGHLVAALVQRQVAIAAARVAAEADFEHRHHRAAPGQGPQGLHRVAPGHDNPLQSCEGPSRLIEFPFNRPLIIPAFGSASGRGRYMRLPGQGEPDMPGM